MERPEKTVRVRLAAGKVVEAAVVRWMEPGQRALVSTGDDRWPLLVAREEDSDVFYPLVWPETARRRRPAWLLIALVLVSAAALWGVGRCISGRPRVVSSPSPRRVSVRPPARPVVAPRRAARTAPALPTPTPVAPRVRRVAAARPAPPPPPRVQARGESPMRMGRGAAGRDETAAPQRPAATSHAVPAGPQPVRYYRCDCGRVFTSERALAAHRARLVYSCIRYPSCRATATTPEGLRAHYESQLETHGPCYSEAIRFGNRYKLVARSECEALAAGPAQRRTVSVPGRVVWEAERGERRADGWRGSPVRASSRVVRPRYRMVWYWNPRTRRVFPVRVAASPTARGGGRASGYRPVLARR